MSTQATRHRKKGRQPAKLKFMNRRELKAICERILEATGLFKFRRKAAR